MAIAKRYQVFVSSTFTDLTEERQVAVEAILKSGHIPAGMELFAAGSQSQLEVIREWIDGSDMFVLILGGRYGSIEPTTKKSYIHLEYEHAIERKKPLFAVVMDDPGIEAKVKTAGRSVLENAHEVEFRAFRENVRSKMCKQFSDCPSLKAAIYENLFDIIRRHETEMAGWVSGRDAKDSAEANRRVADLSEENSRLRTELAAAQAKVPSVLPPRVDPELDEVFGILEATPCSKGNEVGEDAKNAGQFFLMLGTNLITGLRTFNDESPYALLEALGLVQTTSDRSASFPRLEVKSTPLGNRLYLYKMRQT